MAALDPFARIRDVVSVESYQQAKVVLIGAGGVNSPLALRLAQHGVGHLVVIDHDRVDLPIAARHPLGASRLGELKALGLKELVEGHIPGAVVEAIPERFGVELGAARLEAIFGDASLLICSTDDLEANAVANRFALAYDVPGIFPTVDVETGRGEVVAVLGRGAAPCYECYIQWRREDHENRRGVPMALATMEPTHGFVERMALGLLDRSSEFFTDIFAIRPGADRVRVDHLPTIHWVTRPEAPRRGEFADGPWQPTWGRYHPRCPGCGMREEADEEPQPAPASPPAPSPKPLIPVEGYFLLAVGIFVVAMLVFADPVPPGWAGKGVQDGDGINSVIEAFAAADTREELCPLITPAMSLRISGTSDREGCATHADDSEWGSASASQVSWSSSGTNEANVTARVDDDRMRFVVKKQGDYWRVDSAQEIPD